MKKLSLNNTLRSFGKQISETQLLVDSFLINLIFLFSFNIKDHRNNYILISYLSIIAVYLILKNSGIYQSYRNRKLGEIFNVICRTSFLIILYTLICLFFIDYHNLISEFQIVTFYFQILFILCIEHILSRLILRSIRKKGMNSRNIIFWGNSKSLKILEKDISENDWMGYNILFWFSNLTEDSGEINSLNRKGGFDELKKILLEENNIDKVIFSLSDMNYKEIKLLLTILGDSTLPICFFPEWIDKSMRFEIGTFGENKLVEIWGSDKYEGIIWIKQIFDYFFAIIALLIFSPIIFLIYFLIKIDSPGPAIYKQKRAGLNGNIFYIYKFRTMFYKKDELSSVEVKQATKNDPRITKLGRILRSWSLDELPQLLNILEGNMSLVGPRPHALDHNQIFRKKIQAYMQRYALKPGMTGLAQIYDYRGETRELKDMENRLKADLKYQKNWSLILDLYILFKTIFKFKSKNSY